MLEIKELTKRYRKVCALDSVTLTLKNGLYGLLGPNGAGKSTLMGLITDNLVPDAGEILWNGKNIHALGRNYRRVLGYTPQQQGLYPTFTGRRFLHYMGALKEIPPKQVQAEVERVAGLVNLTGQLDKRLGAYSGGMKQRILTAQALLGNPRLLVLDEPTAGLDPSERVRLRGLLHELAEERIILVATHVVSDVASVADEILILKGGLLLSHATPADLTAKYAPGGTLEDVYMHLFEEEVAGPCGQ